MFKVISDITGKMSAIDRYSQTRLINPESVLEHTGWVCMTCLFIGSKLNEKGEDLDMGVLMSKAAIHDIEEVITGDIASPTKYYSKALTSEIKMLEKHAMNKVVTPLNITGLRHTWTTAKMGKEGFIVLLADKLAVAYKVNQEVSQFGNQTIKGHVTGLMPALLDIKEMQKSKHIIRNKDIIYTIINEAIETCQTLI